jgi:hypothetical protein
MPPLSRRSWRGLVAILALAAVSSMPQTTAGAQTAPSTTICEFKSGPRTGERMRLRGEMATLPIGSPCSDGQGSSGVVVSKDATAGGPTPTDPTRLSTTCAFETGARAGQRQRGVTPSRIGAPCGDREGNHGFMVEDAPPPTKSVPTLGDIPKETCRPNPNPRLPPVCRPTPP